MKRGLVYTVALIIALFAFGQNPADTINVRFRVGKSVLEPKLANNAAQLDLLVARINSALRTNNLDHIEVQAYASPEGPLKLNQRLSRGRCNAITNYILGYTAIDREQVHSEAGGIAWHDLRKLVEATPDVPDRAQVLDIINDLMAQTDGLTVRKTIEGIDYQQYTNRKLIALNHGISWRWMLRNLFPQLRHASAVVVYLKSAKGDRLTSERYTLAPDALLTLLNAPTLAVDTTPAPFALMPLSPLPLRDRRFQRMALKTNLLYYGALMPNIELEWLIKKHWSAALNWDIAWWGKYADNKSYRASIISAEGRYWINPRAPWHGLFAGVFAGGGWYDLLRNEPGYYGDGVMGGVSVGYMWPIARNWSMEASVGAGYAYTRYKEYIPYEGHHVYQRTKALSYFGPLKAKLSIAWRFWDTNKPKTENPEP